jgi:hypothetical protein
MVGRLEVSKRRSLEGRGGRGEKRVNNKFEMIQHLCLGIHSTNVFY